MYVLEIIWAINTELSIFFLFEYNILSSVCELFLFFCIFLLLTVWAVLFLFFICSSCTVSLFGGPHNHMLCISRGGQGTCTTVAKATTGEEKKSNRSNFDWVFSCVYWRMRSNAAAMNSLTVVHSLCDCRFFFWLKNVVPSHLYGALCHVSYPLANI